MTLTRKDTNTSSPSQPAGLLPYAWPELPGCGGLIKSRPEDFFVEEIPAYTPSGTGEHLYIHIRKIELSTDDAATAIAGHLGLSRQQVGFAGMKDRESISTQWLSFHTPATITEQSLQTPGLEILEISRHGNKLRRGHLRGNRFRILIRNIETLSGVAQILSRIENQGFPNYFGPQRLGPNGREAIFGRALVRNRFRGRGSLDKIRFQTNAYQSAMFNALVGIRLANLQDLSTMLPGDLACIHPTGACFAVEEDQMKQATQRAIDREISPSACLPGYKVLMAQGRPGLWEQAVLTSQQLTPGDFQGRGKRFSPKGERRPVREFPVDLQWEEMSVDGAPCLLVSFTLPSGTYATSLLRELCKPAETMFPFPEMLSSAMENQ